MKKIFIVRIFVAAIMLVSCSVSLLYAGHPVHNRGVLKTTTNNTYHPMNINSIFNYYGNNGDGSFNPFSTDAEGFEFNKVTGADVIFEDGIVWGGFQQTDSTPILRVGGSTYNHGLQAGKIDTWPGHGSPTPHAVSPDDPKNRLYRVRPDINPHTPFNTVEGLVAAELSDISRYESYTEQQIYDQYIKDWNEWPAADGAPYTDVNHNGVYDASVDIPGVTGADQTMWYVANDLDVSLTTGLYGSEPMGIEQQRTIWAYKAGPGTEYLGYTIFSMTKLINKSGKRIDSMFVSQWSDPDLGGSKGASDDYVGCDSSRDLGFVYNGLPIDGEFGKLVPSGAYLLLQGPSVAGDPASDSVLSDFKFRRGSRALRMSAFNFFVNGNATYTDPTFNLAGTQQWYNLMNGLIGPSGGAYTDPITGQDSKFLLYGDPVAGSGWLDGSLAPPGDRRMCIVAGPFSFAPGDTQQIYVANTAAVCGDRVSSVDKIKYYADQLKGLYRVEFNKPAIPTSPKVTVTNESNEVVLNWDDSLTVSADELYNQGGYAFEGYNVYQLKTNSPDLSSSNAKRIAVYDKKDLVTRIEDVIFDPNSCAALKEPVQFGGDFGVQHYIDITSDAFGTFGQQLINGEVYYFAVTSYAFNPTPGLVGNYLESQVRIYVDTVHGANPGWHFGAGSGDTVKGIVHSATGGGKVSDGFIAPIVIDQNKLTGDRYQVTFANAPSGTLVWKFTDLTKGVHLVADSNQSGDEKYRIIDGILLKVQGPAPGMGDYSIPAGVRTWSSTDANFGLEGFGGAMGWGNGWFSGTTLTAFQVHNTLIKFASTDSTGHVTDPTDTNISYAYRYVRHASDLAASARNGWAALIPNPGAGYAYQDYKKVLPFAAFDLESNRRLMVGFFEDNVDGGMVDGLYWPPSTSSGIDNTNKPREFFFIFDDQYSTTPDPTLQQDFLNNTLPLMWMGTPTRRADAIFHSGDQFEIIANHPNSTADVFTFTAPKVTYDKTKAVSEIDKINVYPNPYFGFNKAETDKYNRFVRFNHLPAVATIRVFSLSGILVRTIKKNDPGQIAQWDLMNESGIPAASGMYIIYIDMPGIGATKELKLAIIPETQYLDRY